MPTRFLPGGDGTSQSPSPALSESGEPDTRRARQPGAENDASPVVLILHNADRGPGIDGRPQTVRPVAPRDDWFEIACAPGRPVTRIVTLHAPDVLVIDAVLCDATGREALGTIRRTLPAMRWLIAWDETQPQWTDLLAATRASGCLSWTALASQLPRAIDAVVGGETWFPRAVSQSLYLSLLDRTFAPDRPEMQAGFACQTLSHREMQVWSLMKKGMSNKQIALQLEISPNTVKTHLAQVFSKRGILRRRQDYR